MQCVSDNASLSYCEEWNAIASSMGFNNQATVFYFKHPDKPAPGYLLFVDKEVLDTLNQDSLTSARNTELIN